MYNIQYIYNIISVHRLYDVPDSELIKHWEKTYKFIKEAKYVLIPHSYSNSLPGTKPKPLHTHTVIYMYTCTLNVVYSHHRMMDTKVLVHCKMGISRSAATVSIYIYSMYVHVYTVYTYCREYGRV